MVKRKSQRNTSFLFWQGWLFVFSLFVIVFGLGMVLLNRTPLFGPLNGQINPVFWGRDPLPPGVNEFHGWIYAVLGATMAGWGVFLAFIVRNPFAKRERWAWNALVLGLSLWYVVDTLASLYFGVGFNVIFNSTFFVLAALPLFFTRREFIQSN